MRVRLDLAYDGSGFHGWAAQPGLRTVQGEVEAALAVVLRAPAPLTVAGRTDAGVHARGQVAHADVDGAAWRALGDPARRINGVLSARARAAGSRTAGPGSDVVVRAAGPVAADFDARFSATRRHYVYRVCDRADAWDPMRPDVAWCGGRGLDAAAMERAARELLGEHDFLSFSLPRPGATTVRRLLEARVGRRGGCVRIDVTADAFCHSMVRSIAGALLLVGRGSRDRAWVRALVERPSRRAAAPVAPARGLTLESVDYPGAEGWADQARRARRRRSL